MNKAVMVQGDLREPTQVLTNRGAGAAVWTSPSPSAADWWACSRFHFPDPTTRPGLSRATGTHCPRAATRGSPTSRRTTWRRGMAKACRGLQEQRGNPSIPGRMRGAGAVRRLRTGRAGRCMVSPERWRQEVPRGTSASHDTPADADGGCQEVGRERRGASEQYGSFRFIFCSLSAGSWCGQLGTCRIGLVNEAAR